jgi:hypothetical protein
MFSTLSDLAASYQSAVVFAQPDFIPNGKKSSPKA